MKQIKEAVEKKEKSLKGIGNPYLGIAGPGRPKGSRDKKTLIKEKVWENAEQEILQDMLEIIRAQKYIAQGVSVMMVPVYKKEKIVDTLHCSVSTYG